MTVDTVVEKNLAALDYQQKIGSIVIDKANPGELALATMMQR